MLARALNYFMSYLPVYRRQNPGVSITLATDDTADTTYSVLTRALSSLYNTDERVTWRNLIFHIYNTASAAENDQLSSAILTPEQQLYAAAGKGDLEKIKDLIENQHAVINFRVIDPRVCGNNRTLSVLKIALDHQQWDAARYLVEKGANVNTYYDQFWRGAPLHIILDHFYEIKTNNVNADVDQIVLEWVKFFVKHGADLSAVDDNGNSVLHYAVRGNNRALLDYCLEQGVDINLDGATIDIAKAKKQNLQSYGFRPAQTPLNVAAHDDRLELAEELLRRGANVDGSPHRSSPVMIASSHTSDTAHLMLKLFIDYGGRVNGHYFNGETPLHMALKYGSGANACYLLEQGADLSAPNVDGKTPLEIFDKQAGNGKNEYGKPFPTPELMLLLDKHKAEQRTQEAVKKPSPS